ncbi:hypothetical protein Lfu02_02580 [Longispora fulva]|uniref:DNA-binding protein YbaB n=1 Tax=Longispora fulva TaxID=619741 RepID=A0A8J7KF83_9ACTN|nr:YbaB/EbfC family nucleoid-associated protein [Longispora fulva]MBG6135870.1 DNA-binding protein YbaB [Longispora fulva]GIG55886.1 hypothetical protein Lfu02_02580 [Longispora fulva]
MEPVDYERLARDVRSIRERVAAVRAGAESPDGLISAVVGGSGELLELRLDPRIYRTADAAGLSADIVGTVRLAAGRARAECLVLAWSTVPTGPGAEPTDAGFDPVLRELDQRITGGGGR